MNPSFSSNGEWKPLDSQTAKGYFGKCLSAARERRSKTQQELADVVSMSRPVIGSWESGKTAPEPDQAVRLATALDEDPGVFLLLADLQRSLGKAGEVDADVLRTVNGILASKSVSLPRPAVTSGLTTHLSLLDTCRAFTPMTIVVGDKREDHDPQNPGDLYVFSASTVDDRWIMQLGLPPDTEKISDKVLMTDPDRQWLKEKLGKRHILCIGSPASNLFSRQFNNQFLFRFAISREAERAWETKRALMLRLETLAELSKFHLENKADLKQTMRLFKPAGFIDFNYRHLRLGMDVSHNKDFAVISVGRNPFAERGSPYFSILVAGVHHPGTANAVRFLADPANFVGHPLGGILEVDVPAKHSRPRDIAWHNKVEKCDIRWHNAGSGEDPLAYTPDTLLESLNSWSERLNQIVTDVLLTEEEVKGHIELIKLLALAKGAGGKDESANR